MNVLVKFLGIISNWKQRFNPRKHNSTHLQKGIITELLLFFLKNQRIWAIKSKDQRTAAEGSLYFGILNLNSLLTFNGFQTDHSVADIQLWEEEVWYSSVSFSPNHEKGIYFATKCVRGNGGQIVTGGISRESEWWQC